MKGPPRCTQRPAPVAEGHANRLRACAESTRRTCFRLAGKEEVVARPIQYCGQTLSLQPQSSSPGFLHSRFRVKSQALNDKSMIPELQTCECEPITIGTA